MLFSNASFSAHVAGGWGRDGGGGKDEVDKVGGGGTGKGANSKNHEFTSLRQAVLGESQTWSISRKARRELNSLPALPVYPVFEDESHGSDKKSVKKDHMTNIIATSFFREKVILDVCTEAYDRSWA